MPSARTHVSGVGLSRKATNASIALLLALLALVFFFLYVALTAQAAEAQTAVPRTALEAARMPQFAAKLRAGAAQNGSGVGRRYHLQGGYRNPLRSRQGGTLPTDDVVYTNGPINGTTDAWSINFGFVVSDSFQNTCTPGYGQACLTGLTFGAWLFPGDVLQTVEVSITDSEFGGTTYFDGIVNFSQSDCIGNQYGFNICTESGNFTLNNLAQGTYWVNLQNASVNTGDPVYWDENSGPSLASENSVGTIPSEAFTLLGAASSTCDYPPCPECVSNKPQQNFQLIHSFSSTEQAPSSGLAIDRHSNRLYGTSRGGDNGVGLAYELIQRGGNWIFDHQYSFTGGETGRSPSAEIVGPAGDIYGVADGGVQQCGAQGNQYCGLIYQLRPWSNICSSAMCAWNQTVIYRFTGEPDGWGPDGPLVFDRAGNLYGTTANGGLYGQGAVFEISPANGEWTEQVIYSFPGGSGGAHPNSLLLGSDGKFYGAASSGGSGGGVTFQLAPSGDTWVETVIGSYDGCDHDYGGCSPRLVQVQHGRIYGVDQYLRNVCGQFGCFWITFGHSFYLSATVNGWQYNILDDTFSVCDFPDACSDSGYYLIHDLAVDRAGNIYQAGGSFIQPFYWGGGVSKLLAPGQHQSLVGFGGDDFGNLQIGGDGNLYGTSACGLNSGAVWQLSLPPSQPKFRVLHNFSGPDGILPRDGLTADESGNLFGTTHYGGESNNCQAGCGTVFELAKQNSDWVFTSLHSFTGASDGDGALPFGRLTLGADGAFYGTTIRGGLDSGQCNVSCGTVFSLTRSEGGAGSWTERPIYAFHGGSDGAFPLRQIVFDPAGNLYGVTGGGGLTSAGTVFELSPSGTGWTETTIYSFSGPDGLFPEGGLVRDAGGNLYGTASTGGYGGCQPYGCGLVYQLSPSGMNWTETTLHLFDLNAYDPTGDLLLDSTGNLYGVTWYSPAGETAYMLHPSGSNWQYSQIHSLPGHYDGATPAPQGMTMDAAGNLYGAVCGGGIFGKGYVFVLQPSGSAWTLTSLHDFQGSDGECPETTVLIEQNGNLYGTTESGGPYGVGVVWEIAR